MTATDTTETADIGQIPPSKRLPGPDVVRAIALIGVVLMNYHGYLILRANAATPGGVATDETAIDRFFDPWNGPLGTRFAATFVLVAGVGVTLLTRSRHGDREAMTSMRWRLVRRGIVLYAAGVLFDTIWDGTILPYYGAMFAVAGLFIAWRSRWIVLIGAGAAVAGAGISWWRAVRARDGFDTNWIDAGTDSPRAELLDVFVNGTHPLLPWLAFFCLGVVLGRAIETTWWRPVAIGAGVTLFILATIISDTLAQQDPDNSVALINSSTDPYSRSLLYTASALGTALLTYALISWVADRFAHSPAVDVLQIAGQMTLTLYIAHALLFNLLVDWWGWISPAGVGTALIISLGYWVVALAAAWLWSRRFRRGPLEMLYRHITA